MNRVSSVSTERLLPTYRWDEKDSLSASQAELRSKTTKLLLEFRQSAPRDSRKTLPPENIIKPIVKMNVDKRTFAIHNAEEMIRQGEIATPPPSLIPTFMAAGRELPGVEDRYLKDDHPSQEIFAYNRLGKRSWLNKRFGQHCLTAIGFAHPSGSVEPAAAPTRVKAHRPATIAGHRIQPDQTDDWTIISSKTPIALIQEDARKAALISRVTGAVDLSKLSDDHDALDAVTHLSRPESVFEHDEATILGQKALLLDRLEHFDEADDSPFYPVIQTVYLTQIQ